MRNRLVTVAAAALALAVALLAPVGPAHGADDPGGGSTAPECYRDISLIGVPPTDEGTPDREFAATVEFRFTVTSAGCARAGDVAYATYHVMTDSNDLVPAIDILTFAAGDMSTQELVIRVISDATVEHDEVFGVELCGTTGQVRVVREWADAVILNDDGVTNPGLDALGGWANPVVRNDNGATVPDVIALGGHCSR